MDQQPPNEPNEPVTPKSTPTPAPLGAPLENSSPLSQPVTPKKSRKGLIIGIIAAALVVLGGGGVLAYNFWYQNPEKVVADAVTNAIKAKTVTYTGAVTLEGDAKFKLELTGANDAASSDLVAKATFPMGETDYSVEASARFDKNGDLFFKLKDINGLVEAYRTMLPLESQDLVDQLVAKINDRWIKVSADDLAQFDEDASKRQKCMTDALKKYYEDDKAVAEVVEVYKKNKFIKVEQNLGSKDGSLGYTLKADEQSAENFFKGLKDTKVYKSLTDCDPTLKIDEKQSAEQTKTDSENAEGKVELWVHQWTHQITEVKVSAKQKEGNSNLTAFLRPKFNAKVTIEAPQNTTSLKDLQAEIEELLNSAFSAQTGAAEQELSAEEMQMLQELEASSQL